MDFRPAFVHREFARPTARVPQPYCAPKGADGETPMATQRILDFLATRRPTGPCLVVDLDV
ncbi:hypothetical protein, partial [Mesorhizobium sp. M7A.F.Ca.CA.001.05.1.1]|uniref:hypothetical protein n=1 Tax=Mesorhizobium sp. M7A.F.Ca.CA.001.05.1.1 TaxID=2496721 RepID=UPI000FD3C7AD